MTRRVPAAARAAVLCVALQLAASGRAAAATYPGFMPMVTDSLAVFPIPLAPQPDYTHAVIEPTVGTILTRLSDDCGGPRGVLGAPWGTIARQVYSKVQPCNSNMTLLSLDNRGTGFTPVLLDGQGYQPLHGPCENFDRWDARWHPKLIHAREQINVNRTGTELM